MAKNTAKRAALTKAEQKKLDAANAARRERNARKRAERAEQLKLEHFVEVAATGQMVQRTGTSSPKKMAQARDAVWEAFVNIGGVEALTMFAAKYPKEFFTQIFSKLIPRASENESTDKLEELLAALGGGQIPSMLEANITEADFELVTEAAQEEEDDE